MSKKKCNCTTVIGIMYENGRARYNPNKGHRITVTNRACGVGHDSNNNHLQEKCSLVIDKYYDTNTAYFNYVSPYSDKFTGQLPSIHVMCIQCRWCWWWTHEHSCYVYPM